MGARYIFFPKGRRFSSEALDVTAVPGIMGNEKYLAAPENAAWILEQHLKELGVPFSAKVEGKLPALSVDDLFQRAEGNGLHPWVREFATPYQRDGIAECASRDGSILFWGTGAGKSLGSIIWALAESFPTIVVTRAPNRRGFAREVSRFTSKPVAILEGLPSDALKESVTNTIQQCGFVVLGWQILPKWVAFLKTAVGGRNTSIVFDELHVGKAPKRWDAVVGKEDESLEFHRRENIAAAAEDASRLGKRRLGLTATFIADRVRDAWAQLDLIEPRQWGRYFREGEPSFAGRYCAAKPGLYGGIDTSGVAPDEYLDELSTRLSFIVHMVSEKVSHGALPPKRRNVIYLSTDEQERAGAFAKELKAAGKHGPHRLAEARLAEAASRKRKAAVERIEEAIFTGQKVVVISGRQQEVEKLGQSVHAKMGEKLQGKLWTVHGGLADTGRRDTIVQEYMASAGPACLVGSYQSIGESISLHDTDLVVVCMLPYTPRDLRQMEGRFSRLGQKRPVLIEYLICEGTIDEHVARMLLEKLPAVERVYGDETLASFAVDMKGNGDEIMQSLFDMIVAGNVTNKVEEEEYE